MNQSFDNPYERYDLDPASDPAELTRRLRALAEGADVDAEERERIRAAWNELTLHPARRLRAAFDAFPETRTPLPAEPPARVLAEREKPAPAISIADVVGLPSVLEALDPARLAALEPLPFSDDPVLHGDPHVR